MNPETRNQTPRVKPSKFLNGEIVQCHWPEALAEDTEEERSSSSSSPGTPSVRSPVSFG